MKTTLLAITLALSLTACAALLPYLVAAGQIANWIAAIVDTVDDVQAQHFDARPSPGVQVQIEQAIAKTRMAIAALQAAVAAAEASNDGDVEAAKAEVMKCYDELYRLLELGGLLGVNGELSAGEFGASHSTLQLPTPHELRARLAQ